MYHGFAFYLLLAVIVTGLIMLFDKIYLYKKRCLTKSPQPLLVEYARSLFPVLLTVLLVRSFLIQPYRVPTGSLEPTIMPGDFIAVNQFAYGLHMPATDITLIPTGSPKRGDIALFRWPKNPNIIFVKRVIGLPGDHIVYKNKTLTINGKIAKQTFIKNMEDFGDMPGDERRVELKEEALSNVKHKIFVQAYGGELKKINLVVPAGHYFMMGDNRDNSDDSRFWGFVPKKYLIGKAFGIWMSWDPVHHHVRWNRIGKAIH